MQFLRLADIRALSHEMKRMLQRNRTLFVKEVRLSDPHIEVKKIIRKNRRFEPYLGELNLKEGMNIIPMDYL